MAKAYANSWEVTDEFWKRVEPRVPQPVRDPDKQYKRAAGAGRPTKPPRLVFEAILCTAHRLPVERLGSASVIHQKFMLWSKAGFFESLWRAGLAEYDDCEGIAWRWQTIDGAMFEAPLAQEAVGCNSTDRGKKGSKKRQLVDGHGVPLSLVVTGANAHDVTRLEAVLASCMIKRPAPRQRHSKHLCADADYRAGKDAMKIILAHGYIPRVVGCKIEAQCKKRDPRRRARRWVAEACHGWFNRFRKLLARCEKLEHTFLALNHLGAAVIALRKTSLPVNIIYG
ncbi:MAG: IS5 family transposase [Comamonas sp.]|nr:IS5 family transposase [Comamonas sp.]